MSIWQKIIKIIKILIVLVVLGVLSVFTPIFAYVGVLFLDLFSKVTLDTAESPTAMIVLGGGLTKKDGEITLNHYSQSRAAAVVALHTRESLPIITSGAESPWLQDYLKKNLPAHTLIIGDNASMNTCENAVFTAKLMTHHELPSSAYLITDRYHMARARRQFDRAGIATVPYIAPLAVTPKWTDFDNNWVHSRRTIYEMVALSRDIFRPQNNCRSADEVGIDVIETPRKQPKILSSFY
ncbi:MAG: YdcF family protein [Moraxella sp.]|nr:YdcF family protein [Moraxella sp.]